MTTSTPRQPGTARPARDALAMLTLFVVLRIVLPSRYVVGPLGGAGNPAQLFGLCIGLWWVTDRLSRPWPRPNLVQPLKRYGFALLAVVLISYLLAAVRPISPDEQLSSDRSVLNMIAWIGVMLAAMDGLASRERLDTLLRRVVLLGGFEAGFGILQTLTGQTFVNYLHLPGLSDNGADEVLISRGSFLRAAGTATHPIEYGITLAMVLPVALHYAVADAGKRKPMARWLPVGLLALALALSISRSALICAAVGLIVLMPAWPARLRRRMYLAVPVLLGGMVFVLPGFFRTVLTMFTQLSSDSSALSRTDSYSLAWSFISSNPVFGRGTGTFLPRYRILDNQYLGSMIETGLVGVGCLVLLILSGVAASWRLAGTARGSGAPGPRPVAQRPGPGPALGAGIAGGAVSLAFFDAFSFPMIPSMLFLFLGGVGALRRFDRECEPVVRPAGPRGVPFDQPGLTTIWQFAEALRRRWPLAAAAVVVTIAGSYAAATAPGVFYQEAVVVFVAPPRTTTVPVFQAGTSSLVAMAGMVGRQVGGRSGGPLALSPKASIVDAGIRHGVWVRLPNDGGQWRTNFDKEELDVQAVGASPDEVTQVLSDTVERIQDVLRSDQRTAGAPDGQLIEAAVSPAAPPLLYRQGSRSRAGVAALALGLGLTGTLVAVADRGLAALSRRPRRRTRRGRFRPGARARVTS